MNQDEHENFMSNYLFLRRFVKITGSVVTFRDTHGTFFVKHVQPLMTSEEINEFAGQLLEFERVTQAFHSTFPVINCFREGFYDFQNRVVNEWYDRLVILDDWLPYSK